MTHRELLRAAAASLTSDERQRQHVLREKLTAVPCPACKTSVNAVAAAGVDVDAFAFGPATAAYRCPQCAARLDLVVPIIAVGPGWEWRLNSVWLAERLAKARDFDREHPKEDP